MNWRDREVCACLGNTLNYQKMEPNWLRYFFPGQVEQWREEMLSFYWDYARAKYIKYRCEDCEALPPSQSREIPLPSNASTSITTIVDDFMLTGERTLGKHDYSDFLQSASLKGKRIIPRCPWESFSAVPSLETIPIESACLNKALPFLLVLQIEEGASLLKSFFTCERLELKHRDIRPFCRNYLSMCPEVVKPHFAFYSRCFYSRKCWILLSEGRPECCSFKPWVPSVMVLLNPLTSQRIDLPPIDLKVSDAAFSVSGTADQSSSPDCVIATGHMCDYLGTRKSSISVAMWRPGWKTWEIFEHYAIDFFVDDYLGMVFCGKRVRCFGEGGLMCVFDLDGDKDSWGIPRRVDDSGENVFLLAAGGKTLRGETGEIGSFNFSLDRDSHEILKILSWNDDTGKVLYHFYKLNLQESEWIRLGDNEWMGKSWFFNYNYVLSTPVIGETMMFRKYYAKGGKLRIICDDLGSGSSHTLVSDFLHLSSWVDLGC